MISSRYCRSCEQLTRHEKRKAVSFLVGALLTILTAGLFLVVWIPLSFADDLSAHHCQHCGTKNARGTKAPPTLAVRFLCLAILALAVVAWTRYG
jgi:hypothetical protein